MQVKIGKVFQLQSAHRLTKVGPDHKCARVHGHNWKIELTYEGKLDERGMVVDFGEVEIVWEPIHKLLDHRLLNDVPGLENPTSEELAVFILEMLRALGPDSHPLYSVRVCEDDTSWCEVRVGGKNGG